MSGSTRISAPHLRLVRSGPVGAKAEQVLLPASPRLERFAAAACAAGLELEEAVGLALEHGLALEDAADLGFDSDNARRLLNHAADQARASRPLGSAEAAYIRRLGAGPAKHSGPLPDGLAVAVPERLLTRARGSLSEATIRHAVVKEMIAWQIAATLAGRTLGEWALHALAERRSAA